MSDGKSKYLLIYPFIGWILQIKAMPKMLKYNKHPCLNKEH